MLAAAVDCTFHTEPQFGPPSSDTNSDSKLDASQVVTLAPTSIEPADTPPQHSADEGGRNAAREDAGLGVYVLDGGKVDRADASVPSRGMQPTAGGGQLLADAAMVMGDAGSLSDASSGVVDAGGPSSTGSSACDGTSELGLCWYLGPPSWSCNQACANHGGFDFRAVRHVGTSRQGGTLRACAVVMAALGHRGPSAPSMRDDVGLGCHVWADGVAYWLDSPSPNFEADASGAPDPARIACACLR